MNAGKIFSAQKWQYGLTCEAAMTGSGTNCTPTGNFITTLENVYQTSPLAENGGILMSITQNDGPSPATGYDVQVPIAGVNVTNTFASFIGVASLILEFDDLTVYVVSATTNNLGKSLGGSTPCFEVIYSGGTVYWQGSSVATFGSGSYKGIGLFPPYLIPAMTPVLGVGPVLVPFVTSGFAITNPSLPYTFSVSSTLTATAGYRWQDAGGTWHQPPIAILPPIIPAVSGNTNGSLPTGFNPAFGTSTWNAGLAVYDDYSGSSYTQPAGEPGYLILQSLHTSVTAELQIIPNCPRSIKRMQPGYSALWVRTGMPQTTGFGTAGWSYSVTSTDVSLDVNESNFANETTIIHPRQSRDLAGVRDTADLIEGTLGFSFYCPLSASYQQGYFANTPDNVAAHAPPDTLTTTGWSTGEIWNFPATVDALTDNPDMDGNFVHFDPLVTYWNLWGNPHWSYHLWFPGTPAAPVQSVWGVDGSSSDRGYWQVTRDQYNYDLALPPAQQTNTRTSNMLSSITETDLAPVVAQVWNGDPWIGAGRFGVDAVVPPASVTPDASSSGSWSVVGGSITVS